MTPPSTPPACPALQLQLRRGAVLGPTMFTINPQPLADAIVHAAAILSLAIVLKAWIENRP